MSAGLDAVLDDTPPGVGDADGQVTVSTHARLAWLGRVDATEEYPATRIREAWARSRRHPHPDRRQSPAGVVLVYDSWPGEREVVILTVYPAERAVPGGSA